MKSVIGTVLSGGGARAAYQSGVMSAVAEIADHLNLTPDGQSPFKVYTGTSAGSVNAVFLSAGADNFYDTTKKLVDLWSHLESHDVFAADALSLGKMGIRWFDSSEDSFRSKAFLDTSPLEKLLEKNVNFARIQDHIDNGILRALAVTAVDYADSHAVTFAQGADNLKPWYKARRFCKITRVSKEHVMASSAIPLLFPPHCVEGRFLGDGCVGQQSPCGPAIYLGSEKLLVVGVRKKQPKYTPGNIRLPTAKPSFVGVFNVLLDAVMLDGIEKDLEKLDNLNSVINQLPKEKQSLVNYKKLEYLYFSPSVDFTEIARGLSHRLPRGVRFLLRGLGSLEEASEIVSYLLFDPSFCSQLIDIGFSDAMKRRAEIEVFLTT